MHQRDLKLRQTPAQRATSREFPLSLLTTSSFPRIIPTFPPPPTPHLATRFKSQRRPLRPLLRRASRLSHLPAPSCSASISHRTSSLCLSIVEGLWKVTTRPGPGILQTRRACDAGFMRAYIPISVRRLTRAPFKVLTMPKDSCTRKSQRVRWREDEAGLCGLVRGVASSVAGTSQEWGRAVGQRITAVGLMGG